MSGSCPNSGVLPWGLERSSSGQSLHSRTSFPSWKDWLEVGDWRRTRKEKTSVCCPWDPTVPLSKRFNSVVFLAVTVLLFLYWYHEWVKAHHYLHEHWQMGAIEETAAVLWVDMYVYIHTIWLTMHYITIWILLQQRYENHALLLHCTRKSCNKYCSGNTARRQPCV